MEENEERVVETLETEETLANEVGERVLTDDELYAKIETEKMLRRKKVKKVSTLTCLCVAFVLALCVIILAVVPITFKPSFLNEFYRVTLYSGTSSSNGNVLFGDGDDTTAFDTFCKYFNESFNQSVLTALFNGGFSGYTIAEESTTSVYDGTTNSNWISSFSGLLDEDDYFVRLQFQNDVTLTNSNGSTYVSTSYGSATYTFTDAYVEISSSSGVKDTMIYIIGKYYATQNGEEKLWYRLIAITVRADTSNIYDAWKELKAL